MKIAIVGAGAMGARFGYMLQRADQDITFIDSWPEHVSKINQEGLSVIEKGVALNFKIPAYLPKDVPNEQFELLLFFTKAMQLEGMLQSLKHIIQATTKVLVLSNGLGNIDILKKYINHDNIYAGVTIWSSELIGAGKIETTGAGGVELQQISTQANGAFINQLVDVFNKAGLGATASSDVINSIWKKAAFNCVLNTYCTIAKCNVSQFGATHCCDQLVDSVLDEVILVARAEGINIIKNDIRDVIYKQFDPNTSGDHYPSMYQDIAKKRKTEIDYLNGAIVHLGAKHNIATPVNKLLTSLVHTIEDITQAV